jgi:TM2 domain-containing membrane protein YozV
VNAPSLQLSVPTKSTGVAYLLWLFFGGIGAHKFYLGRPGVAVLYICMFVLFWIGVVAVSAMAVEIARDALRLSAQQGNYPSPVPLEARFDRSGLMSLGMLAPGIIAPLSLALLYDLFTIPSQVRAANARLASDSHQTFGASSAGSAFGGADRDEEFAAKKADELVARYIAQRSQSAAPTKATHPAQASAPTFGRRRR